MAKKHYKGYLVDLDGTMYRGTDPIPEAPDFIQRLRKANIPFLFLTNNSTSRPSEVQRRLVDRFGIEAYKEEIYTTSLATADFLSKRGGKTVYVIGEDGLKRALRKAGFKEDRENPDYVVVGMDRKVSYKEFEEATLAIQKGATFIGTNKDTNIPTEKGLSPGAGSIIGLVEIATRQKPIYIGKPEAIMMDLAIEHIGLKKEEVLMVGDNYETDIMAGIQNGIDTLLVFTGFTSKHELAHFAEQPTYTVDNLDEWVIS
ncbi:TIGR01457 family HAD-type hydrolase [Lacticigenium naphthae]|uniref:TIGR01457 family HAD-type hydrolase n=1 Tax=Lacticigenium naphthae TaxID=515351 RepID=UPI000428DAE2|nr:TIGR01457 family HAD-type hydrolase [Lacticigenium naphthae]